MITKASLADALALALAKTGRTVVRVKVPKSEQGETVEHIPILRMGKFLIVTIQVDMHDRLVMALQDDLTGRIVEQQPEGVLIDISSLDMVNSFIGRMIGNIAGMSRRAGPLGAVVVGMQAGRCDYPGRVGARVTRRRPYCSRRREGDGAPACGDGRAYEEEDDDDRVED